MRGIKKFFYDNPKLTGTTAGGIIALIYLFQLIPDLSSEMSHISDYCDGEICNTTLQILFYLGKGAKIAALPTAGYFLGRAQPEAQSQQPPPEDYQQMPGGLDLS